MIMGLRTTAKKATIRKAKSNAAYTVGTMTTQNICLTPYKDTAFYKKMLSRFKVSVDEAGEIISSKEYNFNVDSIQDKLEFAYESARVKFQTGIWDQSKQYTVVEGYKGAVAHFEKKEGNSWAFRITNAAMKKFESISSNKEYVDEMFS